MMMDHHRFIKPSNTSNVMIGGSGSRRNSDTTDELTASDPASADDFYANAMDNNNISSNPSGGQPASLFGDEAFDKINMDFDSIMANNDLDTSNNLSSSFRAGGKSGGIHSSDTSVNSEMLLDKLNAELGGTSDFRGIGHSPSENSKGKLGDIGDELDMELLDALMPANDDNKASGQTRGGQQGSDSSMDQLLKSFPSAAGDGNDHTSDDASIDKLLNIPIIDMDNHNDNSNKSDSNTANINLSLKKVDSTESLCDSMASLPSIGHISPNASFANLNNTGMQNSMQQQLQQQQAMLMQQQQLMLQQQMQQQQQQSNSANNSSIQSIVNDRLSQLPQANELTKIGVGQLEHEKLKLIKRLQEIENTGMPMNVGQQQQQQQQFLMQNQLFLQQQNQLQQQQLQQQQGIASASSMPSLRTGGQMLQGQMELQGQQQQQNNFGFNQQQMMQQQQQQQGGMAQGMMAQNMNNNNMNMNNSNNNSGQQAMQSSMFGNKAGTNNDNNNGNNTKKKAGISSIIGLKKGKDTPLFSFLRNRKRGTGNSNMNSGSNMMSMTGKQQQQLAAAVTISPTHAALAGASNHSNSTSSSGILDAAPIDFSNSSSNPFLRKQMMNNLDKSVNRMNSARGRLGGMHGRGLSSSMRRNMMQQMSTTQQLSKSCKELRRNKSTDSYESAGIISRVSSADHIPARRTGLTPGAAKAQNRRFTLSRSNNSFGNLTKTKNGSRRELTKSGGGSSSRSLPGGGSSTRSLNSNDSQSSLIPIKRRGSMSGGRGGHGAKHKLGSGGGSARRISSVPYMGASFGDSASALQQRLEENQPYGPQHNDGWP